MLGTDRQRLTQPARPAREIAVTGTTPAGASDVQTVDHLAGSKQYAGCAALDPADDVCCPVNPVGEVDVQVTRRTKHHLVAGRPAAGGVRRGVADPVVGLDLCQPDRNPTVPQRRPQQQGCHLVRGS